MESRKAGSRRSGGGVGHPRPGTAGLPAASAQSGGGVDRLSLLLDAAVLLLAVAYLVMLGRQVAHAVFSSDECFHAYLSEWIAGHGRLPRDLPEFYSGLPYFYPPLFHLLGAVAFRLAGEGSLRYLNLVLSGLLAAAILAVPVPGLTRAARRCAVLLCLGSQALAFYAVTFYAETLATLMAVLVALLLLRARARPGMREGVLLGLATGVALLSKQTAPVLTVLLAALAAIDFVRGRRRLAVTMLTALGVGLAIGLPFFLRNAILFGGPLYPPLTDLDQVRLAAMNTRMFNLPPPVFYEKSLIVIGPIVPWLTGGALAWSLWRRRFGLVTGLLAGCVLFTMLAPFLPLFQPRHLNPVTALLALLGSMVLAEALARRTWILVGAQVLLIGWCGVAVSRMTGPRAWTDVPVAGREAYRAVAEMVPAGATVLSRSTYDTFYYGRRNATWPIPWGRTAGQLALFSERDPGRFLATLDSLGIAYLLVPRRTSDRRFTGANFPESFVDCVATLVDRGFLKVLWGSADQVLVGRSEPTASAPTAPADAPADVATRTTRHTK